jgi:hypothetical protein
MLVLDSSAQGRWRGAAKQESRHESRRKALMQEIRSNTITVESDAGRDVTNLLAQLGRSMTCKQVMDRLKLCNPNLVFEISKADRSKMGVYVMRDVHLPTGGFERKKVFLFGMESGYMPEFSVMHKAKATLPNPELLGSQEKTREVQWLSVDTFAAETRGWRTVLVRLLHQKLITRHEIQKHFGWEPSQDSAKWQAQVGG